MRHPLAGRALRCGLALTLLLVPVLPDGGARAQDGAAAPADAEHAASVFGAWTVRCERTVGAPADDCAAVQTVRSDGDEPVVLTVLFVRGADGAVEVMRVLAPLGVLLPSGLSLSVDGTEVGVAGFVRCLPPGCISEVGLGDGLRGQLETGHTATFGVSLTPDRQANVLVSLVGLHGALTALKSATVETAPADAPPPDAGRDGPESPREAAAD